MLRGPTRKSIPAFAGDPDIDPVASILFAAELLNRKFEEGSQEQMTSIWD